MRSEGVKRLARLAMLAAVSLILMYVVRFPIFAAAPYLEYNMADVPILIGTFMYGPWWGLLLTVIVSILQGVTVSAGSGLVGIAMHIIATGLSVIVAGCIYSRNKTFKRALIGLLFGSLAMVAAMIPLNLTLTVYYNGVPYDAVVAMLIPIIIPFNLIKAAINSVVTVLLYKRTSKLLKLEGLTKADKTARENKTI